jgi:hypothetical protein
MQKTSIVLTKEQVEEIDGELDSIIGLARAAKKTLTKGENPHLATLLEMCNLTVQTLVLDYCEVKDA